MLRGGANGGAEDMHAYDAHMYDRYIHVVMVSFPHHRAITQGISAVRALGDPHMVGWDGTPFEFMGTLTSILLVFG